MVSSKVSKRPVSEQKAIQRWVQVNIHILELQ